MITGSGLIARAFIQGGAHALGGTCVYAAGVSNSGCKDEREYQRERVRLDAALAGCGPRERIVYFSTCSIEDPSARDSDYVKHKIRMENRIRERERYLILRLPQVAGGNAESPYPAELSPCPHSALGTVPCLGQRNAKYHRR